MSGREARRAPVEQSEDPLRLRRESSLDAEATTSTSSLQPKDLRRLASKGSWKEILQRSADSGQDAAGSLERAAFCIVALAKLGRHGAAFTELKNLGDLDSPKYATQTELGQQSTVPFVLRWLTCVLPAKLEQYKDSQEACCALLEHCRKQLEQNLSTADNAMQTAHKALWSQREERVVAFLAAQHLRLKDYQTGLQWLAWLQDRHPDSLDLLSTIGCVQLNIGHTPAAAATFEAVARLSAQQKHAGAEQLLNRRNSGLLMFAQSDFSGKLITSQAWHKNQAPAGAAAEFEAMLADDPGNAIAANNKAVCQMYSGDLKGALQVLEGSLREHQVSLLTEPVIANLGSMYELCSPHISQASKKNLVAWVEKVAPEDFNIAALR